MKGMRSMLEYLFDFIEHNILIVFLCVLFLGIASAYSKKMKTIFLVILGLAAVYFALLCLYRLGIGIDALYEWSSKYVIMICNQIDYISYFIFQHTIITTKILKFILHNSLSNAVLSFINLSLIVCFVLLTIEIIIPQIKHIFQKKFILNLKELNKSIQFNNTINSTVSKTILNSVFRC